MAHLNPWLLGVLIGGSLTAILLSVLRTTYRQNRLFFWCVVGALAVHGLFSGVLWGAGLLAKPDAPEITRYLRIRPATPPPPVPQPILPKPQVQPPVRSFTKPIGLSDAKPTDSAPPKGDNKFTDPGDPGPKGGDQQRSKPNDRLPSDEKKIFSIEDADSSLYVPDGDGVRRSDIHGNGPGNGERGDNGGVRDGVPNVPWSKGVRQLGAANGRVYFVRLKHGEGGWNAHNEGVRRLLTFLNTQIPCEQEAWALSTGELRDRYMAHGNQPAFLYLYVDESFTLSASDVRVLHEYLGKGGFLFIDSRYDPDVKARVARELARILPGGRLAPLSASHPINRFLFKLSSPGVGLNFVERRNYGITWQRRLAVVYTPGNFAECYELHAANEHEYFTAQYQMGANIMAYAITGGDAAAVNQQAGADARISTQALERLGLSLPTTASTIAGDSTKVRVQPPVLPGNNPQILPATPDEIELLVE